MSQLLVGSRASPSAAASYQQVVASRSDLPSTSNAGNPTGNAPHNVELSTGRDEHANATAMGGTEKEIIMSVCNTFLVDNPPYAGSCTTASNIDDVSTTDTGGTMSPDLVSHSCCAYVTTVGANIAKRVYLQMAVPSRDQISMCSGNDTYNKNVQTSVTSALASEHIPVVFSALTASTERGTVQINPNTPVKPLGTTECCEDLLFGESRITSSPNFCIGLDMGSTYANAVYKYQKYGNVSIGEQITLVPMIHKRAPMVVSMSCPQLDMSHVITAVSGQQTHARFGPNHPARVTEVLARLTPFVQQCCETSMNLPRETVEDLKEDKDMPVPTCTSVEHCFAHNPLHGVGAYVATHVFSLPTAILNTHLVGYKEHQNDSIGTSVVGNTGFPVEQHITVHVAALFGGAVTDRGLGT
ncbi:hypothetical protein T484DRAFT_1756191 [Baffinella frigidus]|nr:hypothetical protein T484DRAFT_1756191 [Cryptophyta sp. CCMP2293]